MSTYAIENFLKKSEQDPTRWDLFSTTVKNLRFSVPSYKAITLGPADSADLPGIAAQYLGSRYLWWVLLHYNGLYDSIEDVVAGMVLKIPDQAALISYLSTQVTDGKPQTIVI